MKNYMMVTKDEDGEVFSTFYDTYNAARNAKMDAECGLGCYCELYERVEEEGMRFYQFLEA